MTKDIEIELDLSNNDYFKLSKIKYLKLKTISEYVFKLANETLLEIIENENQEEWIESRYDIVKKLWYKGKNGINLMRIDFAWDNNYNLKVLELNTSSQGGWILTGITDKESSANKIGIPLAPDSKNYVNYLFKKLGMKIVFIVSRYDYNKELDILSKQIEELGGKSIIIKIDKNCIQKIIDFNPTGIFWKSTSILVNNYKIVIEISKLNLQQIPSFESIFISGDKSFLEILKKKDIMNVIPKTYIIDKNNIYKNLNFLNKDDSVLKPGDLARGENIIFGKNCNNDTWKKHIQNAMDSSNNWVIQELCCLRKNKDNKYEDIVSFIADGEVKGVASRISQDEIINVHRNGSGQSVVLI